MAILWTDVSDLAPELASLAIAAQNAILVYVNAAFDESKFKTEALKMARVYLAAHLGTLTRLQGMAIAGPLIEESDGRLMRKFAVLTAENTTFGGTSYGELLQFMINTSRARFPMVLG